MNTADQAHPLYFFLLCKQQMLRHTLHKTGISILLFFVAPDALAQSAKTDSLARAIQLARHDSDKLTQTIKLVNELVFSARYQDAYRYIDSIQALAEKLGSARGKGCVFHYTALIHFNTGQAAKALPYYSQAVAMFSEAREYKNLGHTFNGMGLCYSQLGQYEMAMQLFLKSLKIKELLKDELGIANTRVNIARILYQQGRFKEAEKHVLAAHPVFERLGNMNDLADSYQMLSIIYEEINPQKTMDCLFKAMRLLEQLDLPISYNHALTNTGWYYYETGKPDSASYWFVAAVKHARQFNYKEEEANNLHNLGQVNLDLGKLKDALAFTDTGLRVVEQAGFLGIKSDLQLLLSTIYAKMKKNDKALEYYKDYIQTRDSIASQDMKNRIAMIELEYNYEKKQKEVALLSKENRIAALTLQRNRILFTVLGAALLLLVILSVFVIRHNKLKARERTLQLQQQLLRSQMNPHFVFNAINSIQTYVLGNEPRTAYSYLTKFARLVRQILYYAEEKTIPLEKELETLALYVEIEQMRFDKQFHFMLDVDEDLDTDETEVPPLLIQPYVENAIWHGLMPLNASEKYLHVLVSKQDAYLKIVVRDNGIGREAAMKNKNQPEHKSKGLDISAQRIEMMKKIKEYRKTSVRIEDLYENGSAAGTRVELLIPITHATN